MLDEVVEEARIVTAVTADAAAERADFEGAWGAWLAGQYAAALATPLPRGWVPHADAASGNTFFLNTRTGEP